MRGIVHPQVQYLAEKLKTKISRTPVPIPAALAAELSAHIAVYGHQLSPWAIERAMRTARKKVQGLPADFRYHDLRHGHIWPDRDESTRATVEAVITARTEQRRNSSDVIMQRRRS